MSFDLIAKSLLKGNESAASAKLDALSAAGFSQEEILYELKALYDNTDDDAIKRQILELTIKMRGMLSVNSVEMPTFNLVIHGDSNRVKDLLCPPVFDRSPQGGQVPQTIEQNIEKSI